MHPLDELLRLAERVATAGAEHLMSELGRADLDVDSKATPTDLVTDVDRAGERLVVGLLHDARPDDGVVGEEGTAIGGTTGVEWVIDPLDGTTNYVYGHPGFSVSIGAEIDGIGSVGVVADPVHGHLFSARIGGGAHRNGIEVRCSPAEDLSRALVATGFAYEAGLRRRQAEVLAAVIPHIRDIRRMGGAAVDLCSVACGRVDAYYERGLQRWDLCAGLVIAGEAGATVGDPWGDAPSSRYCLAAPPALFEPLASLLREADDPNP